MPTCLIVDDSKVVRRLSRMIVESLSFEVQEAANGQEAIDLCKKSMPDIIMLDWDMPVKNGQAFMDELIDTQRPGEKKPVIFCTTADNDKECMEAAFAAGVDDCIIKPVDESIIRSSFGKHHLM